MVIFNSYVKLPEGIANHQPDIVIDQPCIHLEAVTCLRHQTPREYSRDNYIYI